MFVHNDLHVPESSKSVGFRRSLTLGVTPKAVEAWESGKNRPSKVASRMMQLLEREPMLFAKLGLESEEKITKKQKSLKGA
jgi:hypothetical protein